MRRRNPEELLDLVLMLARGAFLRRKFNRCGRLLRARRNVRVLRKNAIVEIGSRSLLYPDVKLSVWGDDNGLAMGMLRNHECGWQ